MQDQVDNAVGGAGIENRDAPPVIGVGGKIGKDQAGPGFKIFLPDDDQAGIRIRQPVVIRHRQLKRQGDRPLVRGGKGGVNSGNIRKDHVRSVGLNPEIGGDRAVRIKRAAAVQGNRGPAFGDHLVGPGIRGRGGEGRVGNRHRASVGRRVSGRVRHRQFKRQGCRSIRRRRKGRAGRGGVGKRDRGAPQLNPLIGDNPDIIIRAAAVQGNRNAARADRLIEAGIGRGRRVHPVDRYGTGVRIRQPAGIGYRQAEGQRRAGRTHVRRRKTRADGAGI